MARIRTIKPELFNDDDIVAAQAEAVIAFIGIFCYCDANGIFEAKWSQLKRAILPERDLGKSFERLVLDDLSSFISIYEIGGQKYGVVRTFRKHQKIDATNDKPRFPTPPGFVLVNDVWVQNKTSARPAVDQTKSSAGREGRKEGIEGKEKKYIVSNFTKDGEQVSEKQEPGADPLPAAATLGSVSSASQRKGPERGLKRIRFKPDDLLGNGKHEPKQPEPDTASELERQKRALRGES